MDLVLHLRYFLVVAEELHFGRAAARLHISQPPLSQRIRRLEQEYGTELFDRSRGQVRLTAAGKVLVDEASAIVARVDLARSLVRRAADGRSGVLRAGLPMEIPGGVLAALTTAFAAIRPEVELELRAATTADQIYLLNLGALDVGVLQHPVDAGGLTCGPAISISQGVVLPRSSPLAAQTEVALTDLTGYGLVLFPRDGAPGLYDETLHTCGRLGFQPAGIRHAASVELLLGVVGAGRYVAFDQGAIAQKEPRVVWRPLSSTPIVWRLSLAWPGAVASPAVRDFADVAGRLLGDNAGPLGGGSPADRVDLPAARAPDAPRPWNVVFPQRLSSA